MDWGNSVIDNNTSKNDEENFTARRFLFNTAIQRKVLSNLYLGVGYAYERLYDKETGGLLQNADILGSEGGTVSGAGILGSWDSRDNNLYPSSGNYHQFSAISYNSTLGSEFDFNSYLLDLRHYELIFGKHIFAMRGVAGFITGNPSFQMMHHLGAYIRGYYHNRFRDRNLLVVETEYRLPLFRRFGMVAFAGCGQVAHDVQDFSFDGIKPSGGIGYRFVLIPEQKMNLRIDLGIGKDDSSFNITILEMF